MRVTQKKCLLFKHFFFAMEYNKFYRGKKASEGKKYECSYYSLRGRSNYRRSHCTALYTKYVRTYILYDTRIFIIVWDRWCRWRKNKEEKESTIRMSSDPREWELLNKFVCGCGYESVHGLCDTKNLHCCTTCTYDIFGVLLLHSFPIGCDVFRSSTNREVCVCVRVNVFKLL